MNKWCGWTGKILRVDLSDDTLRDEQLDVEMATRFVGGKGFAAKLLFDELRPKIDPLGPENKIVFATGPLTGTGMLTSSRFVVATKSPLTGIFIDSYAGGSFGPELKYAGFDAIIVEGISRKPVYLYARDGQAEICDAAHLWGKMSYETEDMIKKEKDRDAKVVTIGPAGERLVKLACVTTDYHHQAARGGTGAVMGSKRLKAVAVRGEKEIAIAESVSYRRALKDLFNKTVQAGREGQHDASFGLVSSYRTIARYGSAAFVSLGNEFGMIPTRNFQTGSFEGVQKLTGEAIDDLKMRDFTCPACVINCGKLRVAKTGSYVGASVGGPEYETIGMLGANCGVDDMSAIIYANLLCDQLGLDTISTGNVIAFAMECFERGIITNTDTDGLKLKFGDAGSCVELVRRIGMREGIGDTLAEGVRYASEKFGKDSGRFACHVKGLEIPSWDPRGRLCFGLVYAVADVGAHHERGWPDGIEPPRRSALDRVESVIQQQNEMIMKDCLIICSYSFFTAAKVGISTNFEDAVSLLSMVTGVKYDMAKYLETAERISAIVRAFNVREGISRKDDVLPWRLMNEPTNAPYAKGCTAFISEGDFDACLNKYYALAGWDHEGRPTRKRLLELQLDNVVKDLYPI